MLPMEKYFGKLELVHVFYGAMPTGLSVSETGRIFICFPKWGDDVKFTVAEIVGDTLQPYPSLETNLGNQGNTTMSFISVQSVVADGRGTLWVLDTAAPNFSKPINFLFNKYCALFNFIKFLLRIQSFSFSSETTRPFK